MTQTVVIGGGVMGASVAYFMAKLSKSVTIVESNAIAGAASGFAGGFLAMDWCEHDAALNGLARSSYELHDIVSKELKESINADIDYRRLNTYSISFNNDIAASTDNIRKTTASKKYIRRGVNCSEDLDTLGWINDGKMIACHHKSIGTKESTAQVHPAKLTHALVKASGATVMLGSSVTAVSDRHVTLASGVVLNADAVVFCLGPWTDVLLQRWGVLYDHHRCMVKACNAHSVTISPSRPVPATALFATFIGDEATKGSAEVYSRPDGQVYICGDGDTAPLPESACDIKPNPDISCRLHRCAAAVSSVLMPEYGAKFLDAHCCYLPLSGARDGRPCIGRLPGASNHFIAAGHGCWGILLSLATGRALAHMIECSFMSDYDREKSNNVTIYDINMDPFDPARVLVV